MAAIDSATQGMGSAMKVLSWGECYNAAGLMWMRYKDNPPEYIYGVPRGGCHVALLFQSLAHRDGRSVIVLDEPVPGTLIVDDIADSGKTLQRFVDQGHEVDALFKNARTPDHIASQAIQQDDWLTFPWERTEGTGAEDIVVRLLQYIGEDPSRDGLLDTPKRVLRAWKEITAGYAQDPKDILARSFDQPHDEMIILRGIEFHSTCEHHLLPFYGTASVVYIPTKSVVGISKLARLVDCFARRLQIQERLTDQIADAIMTHLAPLGVGVVIKAKHSCMGCRGVMKPDSDMVTSVTRGILRDNSQARAEFLSLLQL